MSAPAISVLLPVHNAALHLAEAVESILAQTLADLELLLLDDGSTDGSWAIIEGYARRDPRVVALRSAENRGLPATLNAGIARARGALLARMDADDISLPGRLAAQAALMRARPEIDICGGWMQVFGGASSRVDGPSDDAEIRCALLFSVPLAHPTVMLRRSSLDRAGLRYTEGLRDAPEDYDLWVRAAPHVTFANLPAVLLRYRSHPGQKSRRFEPRYLDDFLGALAAQQRAAGLAPTPGDIEAHYSLWSGARHTRETILAAGGWLERLGRANGSGGAYPQATLEAAIARRWWTLCRSNARLGWWSWRAFARSPLARHRSILARDRLKLLVRCAIASGGAAGRRPADSPVVRP